MFRSWKFFAALSVAVLGFVAMQSFATTNTASATPSDVVCCCGNECVCESCPCEGPGCLNCQTCENCDCLACDCEKCITAACDCTPTCDCEACECGKVTSACCSEGQCTRPESSNEG